MQESIILQANHIRKQYKEFTLGELELNIPAGYIYGIIGPNGAGKTTTIKILMNLLRPDSGDVKTFGLDYKKHEIDIKNRIGYVGEVQYFYENRTVDWTGNFVAGFYKNWHAQQFATLLHEFGIKRSQKIKELSKGTRVKLALALALSHHADLIILDEPTSGLDPIIRREILDLLMRFTEDENKSVLISSHITNDLERIADHVMFMLDGKIRLAGAKDELLQNWKKIHFKPQALDAGIKAALHNVQTGMFGSTGLTNDYETLAPKLQHGIEQENIKIENISLDDILISMVEGN